MDHQKIKSLPTKHYFCFTDYSKAFDCVDHSKMCRILKEVGIADHLTCLMRNLCAGEEAPVRTRRRTTDMELT